MARPDFLVDPHAAPWPVARPMIGFNSQTRTTLTDLLHLAWPVVLARIGIMTMGLTDVIVVGNYSGLELAYSSLALAPTAIIVTTAVGLMMGVQVMTARLLGEGRRGEVGGVLRRGVVYSLQIGFVSMIGLILIGPWALQHMGLADGLGEGASPVLVVFALSMPGYLVSVAAQFFLEALHRPRAGMWAMWIANGVNLALNLLLVPDLLGLGVDGADGLGLGDLRGADVAGGLPDLVYIVRLPEARALGVFRRPEARSGRRARAAQGRLRRRQFVFHRGRGLRRHDLHRRPAGRDRDLGLGHRAERLGHRLHGPDGAVVGDGGAGRAGLWRRRRARRDARRAGRHRRGHRPDAGGRPGRLARRAADRQRLQPRSRRCWRWWSRRWC